VFSKFITCNLGIAPSSTSENSTNPELKQSKFFKLGKASDDVNECGSFLIDKHPLILKVDSIFRVFNAGRLSKEYKCNLSTLSFENNVMTDGRILILLHFHTTNSSRYTIDWIASGNIPNLPK
jgi:hypothetical protein